jgi:ubiquinone biosynthesis protein
VRDFGLGFLSLLGRHGIQIPVGYGLLVKSLVTVEGVSRALYPDIDIIEAARPFVTRLLLAEAGRPHDLAARAARALRAALAELVA